MSILTRDEARALTSRVLGFATAEQTRVTVASGWSGNTRFAARGSTTAGDSSTNTLPGRCASACTGMLAAAPLNPTVGLTGSSARLAPQHPEIMPEFTQRWHATVDAFAERTADLGPEGRAMAAKPVPAGAD